MKKKYSSKSLRIDYGGDLELQKQLIAIQKMLSIRCLTEVVRHCVREQYLYLYGKNHT